MTQSNRLGNIVLSLIALLLLVLVIQNIKLPVLEPTTGFHAVTMNNGQTFFGRLNNLNSPFPEMTEVHLLQRIADPESGQVRNVLVKRRGTLHAPVRTKINAANIVVVEPVHPQSKLSSLITELRDRNVAMIDAQGDLVPVQPGE